MKRLLEQIRKSFEREHFLFAVLKIVRYGYYYVRSFPLRWSLNAPGLYIGPRFLLLGTKHLKIGRNFYAHSNLWIEAIPEYKGQKFNPQIIIGDRVSMGDSVHLSCNNRIEIGDDVLFGSNIFISDHQHGSYNGAIQSNPSDSPAQRQLSLGQYGVRLGHRVWIGNNVVISGDIEIGSGAIVAANSVVTKNVLPNSMVAGCPAKPIKRFDMTTNGWGA